jgi:hypothetical protein
MDQFLYGIPVIGLVFEFVGYLIAILPIIAPIVMKASVPIGFAALCGVMCERSGVVNIGIEGTMLVAAFVGWTAGVYLQPVLGSEALPVFGITPTLVVALILAILSGAIVSLVHAWLSISVKADQIISGTIINIAAFGITGYLISLLSISSPEGAGQFLAWHPPSSAGCSTPSSARDRSRSASSSSSSSSRSSCSGPAGACAAGPSASIRAPRRRSASTSSACVIGTSCWAASWPGSVERS